MFFDIPDCYFAFIYRFVCQVTSAKRHLGSVYVHMKTFLRACMYFCKPVCVCEHSSNKLFYLHTVANSSRV